MPNHKIPIPNMINRTKKIKMLKILNHKLLLPLMMIKTKRISLNNFLAHRISMNSRKKLLQQSVKLFLSSFIKIKLLLNNTFLVRKLRNSPFSKLKVILKKNSIKNPPNLTHWVIPNKRINFRNFRIIWKKSFSPVIRKHHPILKIRIGKNFLINYYWNHKFKTCRHSIRNIHFMI